MAGEYNKDFYHVCLPWAQQPTSEEMRQCLEEGRETHWEPFSISSDELCKYLVDADNWVFENVEYGEAIRDMAESNEGFVELATENSTFSLEIAPSLTDYGYDDFGGLCLTWNWSVIRDQDPETIDDIVRVVTFVYESLPVSFAFSQIPAAWEREIEITREDVERQRLPDVFWLTIFSPSQSDEIGHSRLVSGPIWRSAVLDDGSTRIVSTPHPFEYSESTKSEVQKHLGFGDLV